MLTDPVQFTRNNREKKEKKGDATTGDCDGNIRAYSMCKSCPG